MAITNFNCDVSQGFNFQKDSQCLVGHITQLKIGEKKYTADLTVQDPTKIGDDAGKVPVVGVLSNIYWQGGHADPITFNCRVSTGNKKESIILQHTSLSKTDVEFSFVIYEYDPDSKEYFKSLHIKDATGLKGLILKNGGELELGIESEQAIDVVSPKNFNFYLGVMPQEKEQQIEYAVSKTGVFSKKWGVTVAAGK